MARSPAPRFAHGKQEARHAAEWRVWRASCADQAHR